MSRFAVKNHRRRGFTLVEIVVVIAVIAILVAIAVPSVLHIQQKARTAELKSQVNDAYAKFASEQIANGSRAYAMEQYRFVKADGLVKSGDVVTGFENITLVCRWDGQSDDIWTDDYISVEVYDYIHSQRYGEFYILYRRGW